MNHQSTMGRLGRVGAGLTAGAIATAGLVIGYAPAAHAAQIVLTPVDVNTDATRATGHNDFLEDGVHVWTEGNTSTDKAAGYFDLHRPLADVGEPTMNWDGTSPAPGLQLTTDFDGDGDVDGILVGETVYGGNWWVGSVQDQSVFDAPNTPPAEPGGGSVTLNGSLAQWRAAYPNAQVVQSGWSLGSGVLGDGVIYGITIDDDEYLFSNDQVQTTEVLHSSDVDQSETRATGHNEFRITSGVRVWTEGNSNVGPNPTTPDPDDMWNTDKAAGYFEVDESVDSIGEPSMDWRTNGVNTVKPGLQLVVDIDGNGFPDGILVGERSYANGAPLYRENFGLTNWWLTNGSSPAFKALAPTDCSPSGCGYGSNYNGTLAEWRDALAPEATVLAAGWSLGSGVKGDGVIKSITVGLTKYTFSGKNQAPVANNATASAVAGGMVSVDLNTYASDGDGDTLTYTIDGMPDGDGVFEHTFGPKVLGPQTFNYTVDDGKGGTDSGTITVNVGLAPTTTSFVVKPNNLTTAKDVRILLDVDSTGAVKGAEYVVKIDGKKIVEKALPGDGTVIVQLGKIATPGEHEISVLVRKGTYTTSSTHAETVNVS